MKRLREAALVAVVLAAAGCDGGKAEEKAAACRAAWTERTTAIRSEADSLTAFEAEAAAKRTAIDKTAAEAEKRLRAMTVSREEAVTSYPDKMKARVVAGKMRLGFLTPTREEQGKPVAQLRFDIEVQGDYRAVAKTIAAIYDQARVVLFDRLEVNITDEYKKWSVVKGRIRLFQLTEAAPPVTLTGGVAASYSAALATAKPAECDGMPEAAAFDAAIAELRKREPAAKLKKELEERDAAAKARAAIADDLVRRRDDNRAIWTAHTDELVEKAKGSVGGLAELTFKENGEPDWKL